MANKYWFRKRKGLFTKDLGYGWMPISWEGGLFVTGVVLYIAMSSILIVMNLKSDMTIGIVMLANILFAIFISIIVSMKKCRPEE